MNGRPTVLPREESNPMVYEDGRRARRVGLPRDPLCSGVVVELLRYRCGWTSVVVDEWLLGWDEADAARSDGTLRSK